MFLDDYCFEYYSRNFVCLSLPKQTLYYGFGHFSVLPRSYAGISLKRCMELANTFITYSPCDFLNGHLGCTEQFLCTLYALLDQPGMNRHPAGTVEIFL